MDSSYTSRSFRLVLACMLVEVWSLAPAWPAVALAAGAAAPARPARISPEQAADRISRLFKALEATVKETPRDAFDPQALAARLPKNPQAIFQWVRDNTGWAPYRGALRGPVGTLMDRTGNSLDRSLLLAELLQWAGHSVRLAHAELTQAPVSAATRRPSAGKTTSAPAGDSQAAIDAMAAKYKLSAKMLRDLWAAGSKASATMSDAVARRAADQAATVLAAVKRPASGDNGTAVQTAAADHWWVQYLDNGKWVDLDLAGSKGNPDGQAAVADQPKETIALEKPDGKVHLDAKYCHEVEVRVVAEHRNGATLAESTALKCTLRPADLPGTPILLQHAPSNWPKDLDLSKESDPLARLSAEATAQTEWVPILYVGDKSIDGSPIQTTLQPKPKPKGGGPLGGFGGFGAIGGASDEDEQAANSGGELTAEWIEYVIRAPGAEPRTIRRPLYDIIGPAARAIGKPAETKLTDAQTQERAIALLGSVDVLIQTGRIAPEFVADAGLAHVLGQRQFIGEVFGAKEFSYQDGLEALAGLTPEFSRLLNLAMCRFSARFGASETCLTCPNILNRRTGPRMRGKDVVWRELFDIVNNEVAMCDQGPAAPGAARAPDAFETQLRQGVLDTVLEEALVGAPPAEAAPAFFTAAAAQGIKPVTVATGDTDSLKNLGLSPDVAVLAQADLKEGYHLVLPSRPVRVNQAERFCWWRVRASTGETVGVLDTGFHQGSGEYAKTVRISAAKALYRKAAAEAAKQAARHGFQFYNGWRAPALMGSLCWDWMQVTLLGWMGLCLGGSVGAVVWAATRDGYEARSGSATSSGDSGWDYRSGGWSSSSSSAGRGSSGTDAGTPSAGTGADGNSNSGANAGSGADAGTPSAGMGSDSSAGSNAGSGANAGNSNTETGDSSSNSNSGPGANSGNSGGDNSYYDDYDDW